MKFINSKILKSSLNENKFFYVLILFICFFILFAIVNYFKYPIIGWDTGYYMSIANEIFKGKIYFIEIGTSYNPLSILILSTPFAFIDFPDFRYSLLINVIFMFLNGIIFYKIISTFSQKILMNYIFALILILNFLLLDGAHFMLETISVFFQLLSLKYYFDFKKNNNLRLLFIVGFLISLSFLSKQYGLFLIIPIFFDLFFNRYHKLLNIFYLSLGLIIPISFISLYLMSFGLSIKECVLCLLGMYSKLDSGIGTGINYTVNDFTNTFKIFLKFNYYIYAIPVFIGYIIYNRLRINYFYFFLFLSSFSVLIFASAPHYYQYIIPYLLLFLIYLYQKVESKQIKILFIFALFYSLIPAFIKFNLYEKQRKEQILSQNIIANKLVDYIPEKSKVYLDGVSPALYYINKYQSINLLNVGYTFSGYLEPITLIKNANINSIFVVNQKNIYSYYDYFHLFNKNKIFINNEYIYILKLKQPK
jgi:hypothetical protein